jgi:hypothetical protein
VGLTDRLQLSVAGLPSVRLKSPQHVFVGIPSPTLSYRLGEAGRSEWVPFARVDVPLSFNAVYLDAGLRTRWWLSDSSSVHALLSVAYPLLTAPVTTPDGNPVYLTFYPSPVAGLSYSVTLGEVVTLGIGVAAAASFSDGAVPVGDGTYTMRTDVRWGVRVGGGQGSPFPLLSVHLNDVWSLTGDASVFFPLKDVMSTHFSAGVLATF